MARGKSKQDDLDEGEADAFDESDQDSRMNDDEESVDEKDLDDELELPPELSNVSLEEKKELYRFKRERSEIEWEQEIDARVQRLSKKIDLQRLKEMHGGATATATASEKQKKTSSARKAKRGRAQALDSDEEASEQEEVSARARAKAAPSQRGGRRKAIADTDEEEEPAEEETDSRKKKSFARKVVYEEQKMSDEEREEEQEEEKPRAEEKNKGKAQREKDSDEESLFDSEEEDLITDKYKTKREQDGDDDYEDEDEEETQKSNKKRQRPAPKLKKKKKTTKRSRKDYSDESEAEDEEEEDEEDALSDAGETNIKHIKQQFRGVAETRSGGARESKASTFESLAELRSKLLADQKKEVEAAEDDFQPAELQDYQRLALRRDELVSLLNEPFFANYVQGCFVRYVLGEIDRVPVYRLCEIIKVENDSKKTYKIPAASGVGEVETAVRFTLSTGGAVRERAKLDRVSNHSLQQNELENHLEDLRKKGFAPLTKRDIRLRRVKQKEFRNYEYKPEEIKAMVDNRMGYNKVLATDYSNAMETLLKQREQARKDRDDAALKKIEKAIDELEAENERQRKVFESTYKKQIVVNRRNRENNVRRDMEAGMRKRKEDLEAQAKGVLPNAVADPFIRRETRPKILWKSTQSLSSDKAAAANPATPRPAAALTAASKTNGGAEQTASATHAHAQHTDKEEFLISDDIDMEQVRQRVAGYLGFDFLAEAMKSEKQKYLEKACAKLPSRGSAAREILRGDHISLDEYIKTHFETATEA